MKYHVKIHPDAMEDIKRNARWWAENHSDAQALSWYEHAFDSLYGLEHLPERHAVSPENDALAYEIRDLLFGLGSRPSYRAIITIQGNTVHVLTVRRAAQDRLRPGDVGYEPESS